MGVRHFLAGSLLCIVPGMLVADLAAADDKEPAALAKPEDSVLLETREVTENSDNDRRPNSDSERDSLEPISQVAEREPELADAPTMGQGEQAVIADGDYAAEPVAEEEDDASQFGAALARAARSAKRDEPPRSLPADGQDDVASVKSDHEAQIAKFNGIQPGISSRQDLIDGWGEPLELIETDDGQVLTYQLAPFHAVEVLVTSGMVEMIKVELEEPLEPRRLAQQLRLGEFVPTDIADETGNLLGQIFPERGVLFMHDLTEGVPTTIEADGPWVSHLVIQPLDPVAFMLRAENRLHGPYQQNIEDLKLAISLDPSLSLAHWLLADIYLATGQAIQAESAAATACELEPDNDAYRLRWARSLEVLARYDDAVRETRAVLDGPETSPVIQAAALYQLGRLGTLGDAEIRAKTIAFYNKAIEITDQLATSQDVKERRAAKSLLVKCHLAIAREIASGQYNNKLEGVSRWVGRASGLAEDAIANDGGSVELRFAVADAALASLADMKPTKDPSPWIHEAEQAAKGLLQQSQDQLWQRQIKWRLGVAYFHAVRIEHTRRKTASALQYGQKAIEYLAEGAKSRQAVPDSEHLVGRLYFHVGAIHAIHEKDHAKALTWYDKASPLLLAPVPVTELAVPRRHGEALVSMGVTYWQQGNRSKALELTVAGTQLVERAAEAGVLGEDALAVPYGNLATMHKEMGNRSEEAKYTKLAQSARTAKRTARRAAEVHASGGNTAGNSQQRAETVQRPAGRRTGASNMNRPPAAGRRPRVSSQSAPNPGYSSGPRLR